MQREIPNDDEHRQRARATREVRRKKKLELALRHTLAFGACALGLQARVAETGLCIAASLIDEAAAAA